MNNLILFLLPFIATVESQNNPAAIGDNGRAVGLLQIHPACVDDVNRITGKHYTLDDRLDTEKSAEIFTAYLAYYGALYERRTGKTATAEVLARIWNGGPRGYTKTATAQYWRKVERQITIAQNTAPSKSQAQAIAQASPRRRTGRHAIL